MVQSGMVIGSLLSGMRTALELYNLSQDIGEQTNLAAKEPKKSHDMREQLIAWRKEVGALMPTPNTKTTNNTETTKAKRKKQAK